MANFKIAFDRTMKHEGGYANDPDDRGGETYMGISRKYHPTCGIWKYVDAAKATSKTTQIINNTLKKNASAQNIVMIFYKQKFWDIFELDKVKRQSVANEIFDDAVNRGVGAATKLAKSIFGLRADSKITKEFLIKLQQL